MQMVILILVKVHQFKQGNDTSELIQQGIFNFYAKWNKLREGLFTSTNDKKCPMIRYRINEIT